MPGVKKTGNLPRLVVVSSGALGDRLTACARLDAARDLGTLPLVI